MADLSVGGFESVAYAAYRASSLTTDELQRFVDLYNAEYAKLTTRDANTRTRVPMFRGVNNEPVPLKMLTDEDYIAAGYDVEVLKANTLNANPLSYVSQFGEIPKYFLPHDMSRSIDYSQTVATKEDLAKTAATNNALGFSALEAETAGLARSAEIDRVAEMAKTSEIARAMEPAKAPEPAAPAPQAPAAVAETAATDVRLETPPPELRFLTDEDYIAAGYDIEELKATALDVDPMAFVTLLGYVPRYVVPNLLDGLPDFARTVGMAEVIAQMFANSAALVSPVDILPSRRDEDS
ncbi:MAG: hypothetical protein FWG72_06905 [Oscillospiraceae bacterium]|nr:hypothetical protein [Oscillospiraceae bacterium]